MMSDARARPARAAASWRPGDIVAYEEMRDLAVTLQTRLVDRARGGGAGAQSAYADAAAIRRETLAVDGFDRKAVDAQTRHLIDKLAALRVSEVGRA